MSKPVLEHEENLDDGDIVIDVRENGWAVVSRVKRVKLFDLPGTAIVLELAWNHMQLLEEAQQAVLGTDETLTEGHHLCPPELAAKAHFSTQPASDENSEPSPPETVTEHQVKVEKFNYRGSDPGQVSQAQIFRCQCGARYIAEAVGGKVDLGLGERWAREEGWSKTRAGWICPTCVSKG